jgi:Insertion element 4 transposase N-terminal
LGVLASSVPRDAVDEAVTAAGRAAERSDGKLPPHVMVYFAMALALFAEEDYEEVAARLAGQVAGELTREAFLRNWRLMAIDGFELDVPDTPITTTTNHRASWLPASTPTAASNWRTSRIRVIQPQAWRFANA